MDEYRLFSAPCCRWKRSSSSAAVILLDVGRDLMLAVRGWIGVPRVGVEIADCVCWWIDSIELALVGISSSSSPFPSSPATIDFARARPTLRVVRGSRRGGAGAGNLPGPLMRRGKVEHWRVLFMAGLLLTRFSFVGIVSTVSVTTLLDVRMSSTTCSWDAHETSSSFI